MYSSELGGLQTVVDQAGRPRRSARFFLRATYTMKIFKTELVIFWDSMLRLWLYEVLDNWSVTATTFADVVTVVPVFTVVTDFSIFNYFTIFNHFTALKISLIS